MNLTEQIIIIALCAAATMLTRFLPFLIFSDKKATPKYITYLGKALPAASFAMLIVYSLRNTELSGGTSYIFPSSEPTNIVPLKIAGDD